jgi:hypothetical protein
VTGDKAFETESSGSASLPDPIPQDPKEHVPELKYTVKQLGETLVEGD